MLYFIFKKRKLKLVWYWWLYVPWHFTLFFYFLQSMGGLVKCINLFSLFPLLYLISTIVYRT